MGAFLHLAFVVGHARASKECTRKECALSFCRRVLVESEGTVNRKEEMPRKVGIIDADLIGRKKHRFPNLVCEKLSAYWKAKGASVTLLLDYDHVNEYDRVYISKVFTDTQISDRFLPENLKDSDHIRIGGTGFFFDKAPDLDEEIEHHMPDYHLYDAWIENEVEKARAKYEREKRHFNESRFRVQFKEYTDYSIGFLTRGCFRRCPFCVNKKYREVKSHSPLTEFYDPTRKKLCFLDDNFFGFGRGWDMILGEVVEKKKPFKFKQGLDERILSDEKCKWLFASNYDGDYTFAFDNLKDYDLIEEKLKMIRRHTSTTSIRFYVLCGFESVDEKDIEGTFRRIKLLMKYKCLPYIMRYQSKDDAPWKASKYRSLYVSLARWCNQPNIFKKMSFRAFCKANQELHKTKGSCCSSMRAMLDFEREFPEIAARYFDCEYAQNGRSGK